MKKKKYLVILLLIILSSFMFARAGGGRSSRSSSRSSSSSSWSSSSSSSSWGSSSSSEGGFGSFAFVVAIAILSSFIRKSKGKKNKAKKDNQYREMYIKRLKNLDNTINYDQFLSMVKNRFTFIQLGWFDKDLSKYRAMISDGVYKRFETQLKIMDYLYLHNDLIDLRIEDIKISEIKQDGNYIKIDVLFFCDIIENKYSDKFKFLNEKISEYFVEQWSFIKKIGITDSGEKIDNCPNCGSTVDFNNRESVNCDSCKTIINNGDYHWVLSEITNLDSLRRYRTPFSTYLQPEDNKVLKNIYETYQDFSVQSIEDKVSNGFTQILDSVITKKYKKARGFMTEKAFNQIKKINLNGYFYDFFYNEVVLYRLREDENYYRLSVAVNFCYSTIEVIDGDILDKYKKSSEELFDNLQNQTYVVELIRSKNNSSSKGNIYTHNCPTCGAHQDEVLEPICKYCDSPINDPKYDWVIDNIELIK